CGFLIAAIHAAGLVTLTHTPSPMGFLSDILGRPSNEKPFLLLPLGYPAEGAEVPDISKKGLDEISDFI
ncbi:MAG: nitroreductase family protein, partial [Schleiferiaceae bacterium]|nr:nitroreductase family protein [Schleiferiaceae bacterium]